MACIDAVDRKAYNRAYYLANRDRWPARTDETRATEKRRREANPKKYNERIYHHQEKKRAIVREVKRQPCADCGGEFPPWVMDLDHVRGDKLLSIGKELHGVSTETLLAEIDKCEVVCANCHRERTQMRRRGGDACARESILV